MPEFTVNTNCIIRDVFQRAGDTLVVTAADIAYELTLGRNPGTNKWNSALLNHCDPADDETYALVYGVFPPEKKEVDTFDEAKRVDEIRAEITALGVSYDRRWQLKRLEHELVAAKKIKGK